MTGAAVCILAAIGVGGYRRFAKGSPALLLLALFLCGLAGGMYRWEAAEQRFEENTLHWQQQQAHYTVVVYGEGERFDSDAEPVIRYPVALRQVAFADGESRSGKGNAFLYLPASGDLAVPGDRFDVTGTLRPFRYYANPGRILTEYRHRAADMLGNLYPQHGMVPSGPVPTGEFAFAANVQAIRAYVAEVLHSRLPQAEAALVQSLVFGGGYNELSEQLVREFAATGIIHILSVSGSHIALLFGAVFWLGRALRLPDFGVAVAGTVLVAVYATLAGWVPPVTRSFIMGTAVIGALVWGREYAALHWLGLTVAGMLLWTPYLLYDISFQLSAGSTLGLVLFFSPWRNFLRRYLPFAGRLADAIALTAAAQVLLIPLQLYYFQAVPVYAVLGNLLVVPWLEAVIILVLPALLLASLWRLPAAGLLQAVHWLLQPALYLNSRLAALPGALWYWRGPQALETLFYYFLFAAVYFVVRRRPVLPRAVQIGSVVLLCLAALYGYNEATRPTVCLPDAGSTTAVSVVHKYANIVYYRESERPSRSEVRALTTALAYAGVRETDCLILAKRPRERKLPLPARRVVCLEDAAAGQGAAGDLQWRLHNGILHIDCGDARVQIETDAVGTPIAAPARGLYIYNGACPSERRTEQVVQVQPAAVWFSGAPAFLRGEAADGGRDLLRTVGIGVYSGRENGMLRATYRDGWQVEAYR